MWHRMLLLPWVIYEHRSHCQKPLRSDLCPSLHLSLPVSRSIWVIESQQCHSGSADHQSVRSEECHVGVTETVSSLWG